MLTKGAIGNLVNRYKAVLKKCNLINTFGSLAVASMLVMGGAGVAGATTYNNFSNVNTSNSDSEHKTAFQKSATTDIIITTEGHNLDSSYTQRIYGITAQGNESFKIDGKAELNLAHSNEIRSIRLFGKGHTGETGASLELDNLSITAKALSSNSVSGIDARYQSQLTVNGNVTIYLTAKTGYAAGMEFNSSSLSVVDAKYVNIDVSTESGRTNGIFITSSSVDIDASLIDIDVTSTSISDGINKIDGLTINESSSTFSGDIDVYIKKNATSTTHDINNSDNGRAIGIMVSNDNASNPKHTLVTFNGGIKSVVETKANDATELCVSHGNKATINSETLHLEAKSVSGSAIGIRSQYLAPITLSENTTTTIIAESSEGSARGVNIVASEATLAGDVTITAKGLDAVGIKIVEAGWTYENVPYSSASTANLDGNVTVNASMALQADATSETNIDGTATLNGNVEVEGSLNVDGTVNLNGETNKIATLGGSGELMVDSVDTQVEVGALADCASATVKATGNLNDQLGGDAEAFKKQLSGVAATTAFGGAKEGMVAPEIGADGKAKGPNSIMDAALKHASINSVSLDRILTNDVRKRLGDIRSDANKTGVWMRWDGGKLKGDSGLTNEFNTIQIGGDTKVAKNCRLGVAGSFTHGEGDFTRGFSELEGFSFAAYATWMGENGIFADVVARLGHFSTEMNVEGQSGDMNNRVASLSGEYGWRFNVCDQFFVEPQVELAYTYVNSEDLQLGNAKYQFDNVDSLTGRAGLVAGWNLPDDRGNVYARASVVQQFMGDAKITGAVTGGKGLVQEIDGDDTWLEYGIGANVKLTDKTYIWADVERTEGADIEEEWRGTVGFRFSF